MNIFVTVGTTGFDDLIRYIDLLETEFTVIMQISNEAQYIPNNHRYFEFTDDIEQYYTAADIVVTHAGAGSIYRLLELNKRIIIVPNMSRIDSHQMDIADYMDRNKFALVCRDIHQLGDMIETINSSDIRPYVHDSFFKCDEIISLI